MLTDKFLGISIITLFALQGVVMVFSKGSIRLQKPDGGYTAWVYNILNLFIILVITPLVGFSLIGKINLPVSVFLIQDLSFIDIQILKITGAVLFTIGTIIMLWSRITLWDSFRLGGVEPSDSDKLILSGPFKVLRHPTYLSIIINSLGLAIIVQSLSIFVLFTLLIVLIIRVIPIEEALLVKTYGEEYKDYQKKVKKILPFVY